MKQLEKILVPVDINAGFKEQLSTAIKIARSYNSEIIIMYVFSEEVRNDEIRELLYNSISVSLNKARETVEKMGAITNKPIIEYGKPVDEILKIAIKEDVNLIVMGAGNRTEKEKFKLGNNVEKLLRHSDIPVWVVKADEDAKITNILCPVDFSDPSRHALKNAILLSKQFMASLRILGVVEPISSNSPRVKVDWGKENAYWLKRREKEMEEFVKEFDLKEVNYKIDIQTGTIHEKILHIIKEHNHDLLIMGTTGRSGLIRVLMGSIAEKVTRETPCSFITVKSQDIIQLRFDNEVKEIEFHFKNGNELVDKGFHEEAINQYRICTQINNMYIPAIYKLAVVHRKIGNFAKAIYYDNIAKKLLDRLWDEKIEQEIRKYYK